ncbi:hypothetical protein IFR05_016816, partial [Cadophora sp. M221]
MNMESFLDFFSVHFDLSHEIKSLKFRTSDGIECTASRDGADSQWRHLFRLLDNNKPSWINVFIGDDKNDDGDLKTWFEWLDLREISEELRKLSTELHNSYEGSDKSVN